MKTKAKTKYLYDKPLYVTTYGRVAYNLDMAVYDGNVIEPEYPEVDVFYSVDSFDDFKTSKKVEGTWQLVSQSCNETIIFWTWEFRVSETTSIHR